MHRVEGNKQTDLWTSKQKKNTKNKHIYTLMDKYFYEQQAALVPSDIIFILFLD